MSAAPLPGFLATVAPVLDHYGYWAIGGLLLLENIGIPVVPGEFALIAGSIYAGAGRLNVFAVAVVGAIACFVGAEIGYAVGRFGGRALVLRYGKYVFVREHHVDRAEDFVSRYGGAVVILARFIVGLRELNGIIAGITGMRAHRFAFYNAIGAVAWTAVWVSAGYFAGDHIATIYTQVQRYSLYALIALVVVAVVFITRAVVRRRRRLRQAAAENSPAAEPRH